MNYKRIIPCLDFFNGRIIKGTNFKNLVDIGDPLDVSKFYNDEGADEIAFLDISASIENRNQINHIISKISSKISIPLTVGGGIKSFLDFKNLFNSGADKISVNTHLIENFNFIEKIKLIYGSQCLISALDVKRFYNFNKIYYWNVYKKSGKIKTKYNLNDLIIKFLKLGIGELLITSIDRDGTLKGFDKELILKLSKIININIIVSGGGGSLLSILDILKIKNVNSLLLASILHNKIYSIFFIKNFLLNNGILLKI
ncbi:imidazole glycerol phosphate synthase catalytic subunit [Candidatus Nasuia deltocephalinicola]|uniref:imidazole glycerol-phosphate synthase n=1 Tax=Candidatus Nasuia deltocephalincola TaxID=1160784 RepID=A0A975A361_9PROT|nr:imidazole glycerol phosphate synthase subunit HisF [Candidatus Nasuia deltocephalinicola]WKD87123.1 imidazole glycerol phosphate synthase cyclase subunit [Candidatus Nasuia deltocephalinicola]BEH03961.1 imidazole glycerol phosphate synthase catalytic subunit [Candidatus Nasuia deltocephalinicola]